jgi:hypothetical protein
MIITISFNGAVTIVADLLNPNVPLKSKDVRYLAGHSTPRPRARKVKRNIKKRRSI